MALIQMQRSAASAATRAAKAFGPLLATGALYLCLGGMQVPVKPAESIKLSGLVTTCGTSEPCQILAKRGDIIVNRNAQSHELENAVVVAGVDDHGVAFEIVDLTLLKEPLHNRDGTTKRFRVNFDGSMEDYPLALMRISVGRTRDPNSAEVAIE
jgi:hypothetical protein